MTKQEETNCTTILDKMMTSQFMMLLRGPLLVLVVLVPLITPYLLSFQKLLSLGLLVVGFSLTCHDITLLLERKTRIFLRRALDSVILDDTLKSIFDPQIGLLPCVVSTVMGNAAMYALPLTRSQRMRLVQSCLSISDDQLTKDILLTPGGVRQLLPTFMQNWLEEEGSCEDATTMSTITTRKSVVVVVVDEDDNDDESQGSLIRECHDTDMESDSDADAHVSTRTNSNRQQQQQQQRTTRQAPPLTTTTTSNTCQSSSSRPPDSVWVVVGTIVKELSQETIQNIVQGIPDSWLRGTTMAGTLALCLQLRSSSRARRLLLDIFEVSATMGLGGLMISALSAMIVKHSLSRTEPQSGSRPTGLVTATGFGSIVLSQLKLWLSGHVNSKKIQAAIAFLVLYSFQRIRSNRDSSRRV